jgi:error-prone DNA polymerase
VFIFQEKVIQAAMATLATPGRRAASAGDELALPRGHGQSKDLPGAKAGCLASTAATVYEKILAFAEFGFPKSHAAAMAETAYKVAWLKRYYAPEFYCALLNEQPMGFYSEEVICNDARRHDIEVRGVDVNHSRSVHDEASPRPSPRWGEGSDRSPSPPPRATS